MFIINNSKRKMGFSLFVLQTKSMIPEKNIAAGIYLFKVNNENNITMCGICSTLIIKTFLRQPCLYNFLCFCNCFVRFEGSFKSSSFNFKVSHNFSLTSG